MTGPIIAGSDQRGEPFFDVAGRRHWYAQQDDAASMGQCRSSCLVEREQNPFVSSRPIHRYSRPSVASGAVARLVGIEGGVVSEVINLESSGVEAPDRRPRHDEHYHEA
jgi:hypothetical protein